MAKQITEKRLLNIALFYLSKYEASAGKVRQMLHRRLLKAAQQEEYVPENAEAMIEKVICEVKRLGYVDDRRYAQMQTRILCRQGKSALFIRQKLIKDGIAEEDVLTCLESAEISNETQAFHWLKKHRKGGFREKQRSENYKKDLASLTRQGFSFQEAKEALDRSFGEEIPATFNQEFF